MIIGYAADAFIRIRFQVAVAVVGIAGAAARFEALGFAAGISYGGEAVGRRGVGVGEVIDLPEVARALDEALPLQGGDVAAQVVREGFVEAAGGRCRAAGIDVEIRRRFQAAEGIVGEGVGLPLAPAHPPGHLRDVAALLQRAAQAADRAAGFEPEKLTIYSGTLLVISDSPAPRGSGGAGADCGGGGGAGCGVGGGVRRG